MTSACALARASWLLALAAALAGLRVAHRANHPAARAGRPPTAVVVKQGGREVLLDQPYAATRAVTDADPGRIARATPRCRRRSSDALAAQPSRAAHFTLYFVENSRRAHRGIEDGLRKRVRRPEAAHGRRTSSSSATPMRWAPTRSTTTLARKRADNIRSCADRPWRRDDRRRRDRARQARAARADGGRRRGTAKPARRNRRPLTPRCRRLSVAVRAAPLQREHGHCRPIARRSPHERRRRRAPAHRRLRAPCARMRACARPRSGP